MTLNIELMVIIVHFWKHFSIVFFHFSSFSPGPICFFSSFLVFFLLKNTKFYGEIPIVMVLFTHAQSITQMIEKYKRVNKKTCTEALFRIAKKRFLFDISCFRIRV